MKRMAEEVHIILAEHKLFYRIVKRALKKKDREFFLDGKLKVYGLLCSVSEDQIEEISRLALVRLSMGRRKKRRLRVKCTL